MSEYEHRYKRPHQYKSKLVVDGTVDKVKQLKAEKKSFAEIGSIIGKSRQQVAQIYYCTFTVQKLFSTNQNVRFCMKWVIYL